MKNKIEDRIASILKRVESVDLPDIDIESESGIAKGFLWKSRNGHNRKATQAWKKLESWLDAHEGKTATVESEGDSLGAEIQRAETAGQLRQLTKRIGAMAASGELELRKAEVLERLVARCAKLIEQEKEEKAAAQVRALEILTPAEAELLKKHRSELAGPALKPGEAVAPPEDMGPAEDED